MFQIAYPFEKTKKVKGKIRQLIYPRYKNLDLLHLFILDHVKKKVKDIKSLKNEETKKKKRLKIVM